MVDWKAESMIYNLPEEERMSIPYAPFLSHPLPPSMGGSKCAAGNKEIYSILELELQLELTHQFISIEDFPIGQFPY